MALILGPLDGGLIAVVGRVCCSDRRVLGVKEVTDEVRHDSLSTPAATVQKPSGCNWLVKGRF